MKSLEAELRDDVRMAGALQGATARLTGAVQDFMLALQGLAALADSHASGLEQDTRTELENLARELQQVQLCALENVRHLTRAKAAVELENESTALRKLAKQGGLTGSFMQSYGQYQELKKNGLALMSRSTGLFLQNLGSRMQAAGARVLGEPRDQQAVRQPQAPESPGKRRQSEAPKTAEIVVEPSRAVVEERMPGNATLHDIASSAALVQQLSAKPSPATQPATADPESPARGYEFRPLVAASGASEFQLGSAFDL